MNLSIYRREVCFMSNTTYNSHLASCMEAFVVQKHNLGYKAVDIEYALRTIDKYLVDFNFTDIHITESIYVSWWNSTEGQQYSTRYSKASIFIRFLKYLASLGIDCYIPRLPRTHTNSRIPYTFSEDEIARIFLACDKLRIKERHMKSIMISIPALIRLMYSTAIRISEALAIRVGNVDFNHHVIKLEYTKNGHQRFAPINDSLEIVLRQYLEYRKRLPYVELRYPESYLFVSSCGKPIARKSALTYMHRIIAEAGIEHKGNEEGPHLHSLRHSACVHSMINSARKGIDLYSSLPILSVFMGHRKVLDTENYLRMTQEMYPEIIRQDLSVTAGINRIVKRATLVYDEEND